MLSFRSNSWILIGAVVFTVLLIIFLFSVPVKDDECKLDSYFNWDYHTGLYNFGTADDRNLVNFVGVLEVRNFTTSGYLPIILNSAASEKENGLLRLKMISDCAKLTFNIKDIGTYVAGVQSIEVDANFGKGYGQICTVRDTKVVFFTYKHYECGYLGIFDCDSGHNDQTNPKYTLTIYHLGIEVDGDPGMIRDGKFSKNPEYC